MIADPGWVDPDPDPTLEKRPDPDVKKHRIRVRLNEINHKMLADNEISIELWDEDISNIRTIF